MSNRSTVKTAVRDNPGISFTELMEETGLATGTLQYHVRKSDDIVQKRSAVLEKDRCERCELSDICTDKCLLSIMRDPLKAEILKGLDEGRAKKGIASDLDIHPSTLSYHVKSMREHGLLDEKDEPHDSVMEKL